MLYYEYISYSYNYTIKLYLYLDKRKTPCFNVVIWREMLYLYAIQVYSPCVYGSREANWANTLWATPLPLVDDPSNTIACPVE